jgi:hypothetical protein
VALLGRLAKPFDGSLVVLLDAFTSQVAPAEFYLRRRKPPFRSQPPQATRLQFIASDPPPVE